MPRRNLVALLVVAAAVVGATQPGCSGESRERGLPPVESRTPSVTVTVDGKQWRIGRLTSSFGESCVWVETPFWHEVGCQPRDTSFLADGPVYAETRRTHGFFVVSGVVARNVKNLRLLSAGLLDTGGEARPRWSVSRRLSILGRVAISADRFGWERERRCVPRARRAGGFRAEFRVVLVAADGSTAESDTRSRR